MRARRDFSKIQRPEAFGIKFRSGLEARYARYLEMLLLAGRITSWSYETQTFWFTPGSEGASTRRLAGIRRGVTSYKPDFVVNVPSPTGASVVEYHEVKGYLDARGRVALNRMKRYYPAVRVVLVTAAAVKQLGY